MDNPQSTRQQYNDSFLKELDRLNPAQKEAVVQIEGPVLVVAGPGTGKTHILASRIGYILLNTDTDPRNILCLTFTDAAVTAMRERLVTLIGPEAHRVHIYTFHSFCNSIIQENLELFGRHGLEPLGELERVELIRRIIDNLGPLHPLKQGRSDIYFYEEHLFDLFQQMKAEHWPVKDISNKIDAYLEDLPNRQEFVYQINRGGRQKGMLKETRIDQEKEKMARLKAASALYPFYLKEMDRMRRYDYADMILWVAEKFQKNEALLRNYQERYLYFLIDEYQDTNGAQYEIIRQLTNYWDKPNLFIVGDDDQSIYEFQGARLKNLTDFYERYKNDIKLVVLSQNYRSSQLLLDAAGHLIEKNDRRIVNSLPGIEKKLLASLPGHQIVGTPPRIISYPNRLHEETDILLQIEKLHQEGISLNEIAIIYAKHRQAERLIQLLEKKKIPYRTKRQFNVLDVRLVQQLITFLEYIAQELKLPYSGEHLIFQILHFQFLKLPVGDISKLSGTLAKIPWERRPPWRDFIKDEELMQSASISDYTALIDFSKQLDHFISTAANSSVLSLMEQVLNRSGILSYVLDQADKVWLLQVLNSFFDFTQKESIRNPRLSLSYLLEQLKRMEDNRIRLPVQRTIRAEEGISLVTAHSAKGLEFDHVFIFDCTKEQWEPRSRGSRYRFPLPDTLTYSGEEDALEARRRLFYVAMTRAKTNLQISFSRNDKEGKQSQKALFVEELLETPTIKNEERLVEDKHLLESQQIQLEEKIVPQIAEQDKLLVEELLAGFVLSISAMNKFLKCPLSFYYENVLRVPTYASPAANYGTAMHDALQRFFEQMLMTKGKIFPGLTVLLGFFEYEMQRLKSQFVDREFQRRLTLGRRHLTKIFHSNIRKWHRRVLVEYSIRNVEINGVPITGTIDKLEFLDGQSVHIVDYKTGTNRERNLNRPKGDSDFGGNYWRQLVFYKILYEAFDKTGKKADQGTIAYLEPNNKGEYLNKTLELTVDDVEIVKSMMEDTYNKIKRHKFYTGCDEENCIWCRFVKQNITVDSFRSREIEALDDRYL